MSEGGGDLTAQWERFAGPWIEQARTWGLSLDSPGLGATREFGERWNKAISTWLDLARARNEYAVVIAEAWRRIFEEFGREMIGANGGRGLLAVSVDHADRIFAETFRSPRYLEAQQALLDALSTSRAREGELIEEMASTGHLATRRELDEVYRRLDDLRREIRALKKAQRAAGRSA